MPSDAPGTTGPTPLTRAEMDRLRELSENTVIPLWYPSIAGVATFGLHTTVNCCRLYELASAVPRLAALLIAALTELDAAHDVIARALAAANAPVPPGEDPDDVCIRDLAAVINVLSAPETGPGGSDHAQEGQNAPQAPQEGKNDAQD